LITYFLWRGSIYNKTQPFIYILQWIIKIKLCDWGKVWIALLFVWNLSPSKKWQQWYLTLCIWSVWALSEVIFSSQGFVLVRQALYCFQPIVSGYCGDIVSLFAQGWPGMRSSYFRLLAVTRMIACTTPPTFLLRWGLTKFFAWVLLMFFCSGWPQTMILPNSASQIARITGVSHQCRCSQCFWHCLSSKKTG
jgi:hypothetical protein